LPRIREVEDGECAGPSTAKQEGHAMYKLCPSYMITFGGTV
jgi:hypothetical protein